MKTQVNFASNLVVGIAMLASAPFAVCGQEADLGDELRLATASVESQVAQDLAVHFEALQAIPQPVRARRAPTVEVVDVAAETSADMYVVVVEASRLPALESVTAQVAVTAPVRF